MNFENKIVEGKFICRYKRFFVDIDLNGEIITAYCPNTGSLFGLLKKKSRSLISIVEKPNVKLRYRLEAIENSGVFVGVNTSLPNKIVYNAIKKKKILSDLKGNIKTEVKYGTNSRIDILIDYKDNKTFIEVKSVTLSRTKNIAEFPDAVTSRGSKHLKELSEMSKKGYQCIMIYLIQRSDVNQFKIAKDIDEEYYKNASIAKKCGVQFLAYNCKINKKGISLFKKIDIYED